MGGDGEESGGGGASSPPPHPSSPADAGVGGWQAFQDDEGRTYYYHAEREETQWEAPEGFVPAAPGAGVELGGRDQGAVPGGAADAAADAATGARAAPAQEQAPATAQDERRWVGYRDDEGRTYYFNEATGETQWERPEGRGVTVIEEEEEGGAAADSATAAAAAPGGGGAEAAEGEERDAGAGDGQGDGRGGGQGAAAPVEAKGGAGAPAERDPREVALEEAEEALNQPDAVLEFDCLDNIREVIDQRGSSVGGPRAMQSLVSSHQGLTAVSGLLGLWLAELRSTLTAASGTRAGPATAAARGGGGGGGGGGRPRPGPASGSPGPFGEAADHVRSVAGGVVSRFAMEHFTKTSGDNILNLSKAEATFLEEMIGSSTWRRLLIDLSARHTDSALLTYCLKAISKGGHHREIAKRIDQSDYFGVFNSMLTSEVEQIGMISASTVASSALTDGGMAAILTDLRRTCTSTSYTYVYTREVLRELVTRAGAEARTEPDPAARAALMRAVRRWERLREELEAEMVAPGAAAAGSSMLERKRKLDVALMTSDLHQRQRRRTDPTGAGGAGEAGPGLAKVADMRDMARDALDMAAAKMIKRYASGLSLDSDTTEQLLRASYGDSKLLVGDVLNAHPTALEALMTYLYKPGRMRVKSIEIRHRCAKLVALSALALQEALANQGTGEKGEAAATTTANGDGDEGGGGGGDGDSDGPSSVNLDESTKAVLRGSQLCEQIENVVSFTAVDDATHGKDSSAGRELSSLCIRHAPVGRGALVWATERARSADFCDSAAYPTLAPSILSLARIVGLHHPLLRPMAIDLALTFIGHSPPDLAFQKVQALKEQSLRLLLLLATRGEAARVLGAVGTSGLLDAPNLRYFVAGLLQVVQPPVSLALVHSLGGLLSSKACVEALRSLEHFAAESRAALMGLLDAFRLALSSKGNLASSATPANKALVSNLILLYR